jgi:hypothetical protein
MSWQRLADFKTFRQVTEKGGVFFNAQHSTPCRVKAERRPVNPQPSTSLSSPCDKGWCPVYVYGIKSMAQNRSGFILARAPRVDLN